MDQPDIEHPTPDLTEQYEEAKRLRAHLADTDDDSCPYCTRPEGWDACPVHPHTPPPNPHAQS